MLRLKLLALAHRGCCRRLAAAVGAQPWIRPPLEAAAEERQRQQDATPDTPGTGPYAAIKELDAWLPEHVIYRPANLASLGNDEARRVRVRQWRLQRRRRERAPASAGGRFARLPRDRAGPHLQRSGQIARPARPSVTDPATAPALTHAAQLQEAIDWALKENGRKGSRYFGRIDPRAVAISGFSCGGIQALLNAKDPRIATAVIMNSGFFKDGVTRMAGIEATKAALADLHFPTLYILGGPTDIAYANGMDDFAQIDHVPVAVANIDKGHGGTYWEPNGGAAAHVVVHWLEWRLRGDEKAAPRSREPPAACARTRRGHSNKS